MADGTIAINEPTSGDTDKRIDTEQLTVSSTTVERERIQVTGTAAADIASVDATAGLKVDLGADNDVTVTGDALTALQLIDDAISGSEMQVDIVSGNVTNAGTFVTQLDGDALTALQLIDNIVQTEDAAHTTGDSGVMLLGVENEDQAALTAGDKDYTPIAVTPEGNIIVKQEGTVTVDGSGVTQPVSGTVTANLSATDNAVLDTIDAVLDTIKVDTEAIETAVELIDDAISGNEMQVDVVAALPPGTNTIGQVGITDTSFAVADGSALGEGVLVQGDDGTDRKNINVDATTGDVQVDVTNTVTVGSHAVTNAGTFATQVDGDALTALQLIDNIVQVEDVAHSTGDSGVMLLGVENEDQAALTAGDKDYTPVAVTPEGNIIVKQEGSIAVDSHAVTNAGTFATQATLQASTANIGDVDLELAGTAVSGNNGNADAGTIRVTVASDTTGVLSIDDNGGDISIDDGGNVITIDGTPTVDGTVAHDGLDSGGAGPVKIGGRAQDPWAQPEEVADNDRVDALFDENGYQRVRGDLNPSFADINDSTSGNNTIQAAAGAGKRIAVWAILVVSDGTTDVRWEDGAGGTAFTGQVPLQAREGYSISAGGIVPLFVGAANTLLNMELTANVNVHGFVSYTVMDD